MLYIYIYIYSRIERYLDKYIDRYTHLSIYLSIYLSLSLSIYIYIYGHTHTYMYTLCVNLPSTTSYHTVRGYPRALLLLPVARRPSRLQSICSCAFLIYVFSVLFLCIYFLVVFLCYFQLAILNNISVEPQHLWRTRELANYSFVLVLFLFITTLT